MKTIGLIMAVLIAVLGFLFLYVAANKELAHPIPAMLFLSAIGLFVGASIVIMLVVVIDLLNPKNHDTTNE